MKIDPMVQLKKLIDHGYKVQLECSGAPTEYEVTVFWDWKYSHSHYGGDNLSEAINKAWQAMPE